MTNETLKQLDPEDQRINAKHRRIRGSMDLKYPLLTAACKVECKQSDESVPRRDSLHHRCVLAIGHEGDHQWPWECRLMKAGMTSDD